MTIHRITRRDFQDWMRDKVTIDVPDIEDAIQFIRDNLEPEDVFSESSLESWADKNDYIKKDE